MSAVYDEQKTAGVPWTWRAAFRHARNVEPIMLAQAPWAQASVSYMAPPTASPSSGCARRALTASRAGAWAKPAVNTFWDIPIIARLIAHP